MRGVRGAEHSVVSRRWEVLQAGDGGCPEEEVWWVCREWWEDVLVKEKEMVA